ncbi:hypothetical protein [Spirillospora sp. NPDC047279]|uniref:hypothetical protein n=1 Tax=Spirillospora sp. NPDC047279 TaxID=3155478 RepID=UPI0033F852C7
MSRKERVRILLAVDDSTRCGPGRVTWCRGALVEESTLFVRVGHKGGRAGAVPIVAYDLRSGDRKWESGARSERVFPVRVDGGRLIVVQDSVASRTSGRRGSAAEVQGNDLATGKTSTVMTLAPSGDVDSLVRAGARSLYVAGAFVFIRSGTQPKGPSVHSQARRSVTARLARQVIVT